MYACFLKSSPSRLLILHVLCMSHLIWSGLTRAVSMIARFLNAHSWGLNCDRFFETSAFESDSYSASFRGFWKCLNESLLCNDFCQSSRSVDQLWIMFVTLTVLRYKLWFCIFITSVPILYWILQKPMTISLNYTDLFSVYNLNVATHSMCVYVSSPAKLYLASKYCFPWNIYLLHCH
jgi:hypothetical protein